MNQIDSDLQVSASVRAEALKKPIVRDTQRLIVIIRDAEEEALLASRILGLAEPRGLDILLVGIAPDSAKEATLRRKLVTIAAFLNERSPRSGTALRQVIPARCVDVQMQHGRDWIGSIRSLLRPDDTIACYTGETVGMLERPLSDILASGLNRPIYTFTGLRGQQRNRQNYFAQAASWVSSIASIGGFLALQARIVTAVQGTMQSVLLLVTVLAEVGIIWGLNSLFGQS